MNTALVASKAWHAYSPPGASHSRRTPRVRRTPRTPRHQGQSAVEYLVVCAALAAALGLALTDGGALAQLRDGFMTAYRAMTYALSLPW